MQKIADLTHNEAALFDRLSICKLACREIVKEVVSEYEAALAADQQLFARLAKKHGISIGETSRLLVENGSLWVTNECEHRLAKMEEMQAVIDAKIGRAEEE